MNNKVKAYQGSEKYAFISYAHKDSKTVYPIIKQLSDLGYRIWYDEGIPLVSDYGGVLYDHIKDCAAFIIFKSFNSVASRDVELELTHAIHFQKKIVQIVIDDKAEYPPSVAYGIPASVQYLSIKTPGSEFYGKLTEQIAECYNTNKDEPIRHSVPAQPQPDTVKRYNDQPVPKNVKQFLAQFSHVPEYKKLSRFISVCVLLLFGIVAVLLLLSVLLKHVSGVFVIMIVLLIPTLWLFFTYSRAASIAALAVTIIVFLWFGDIVGGQNINSMTIASSFQQITIVQVVWSLALLVSAAATYFTFRAAAVFKRYKHENGINQ